MATVISIAERRDAKARPAEKRRSLNPGAIVLMFTVVALAMTAAAVLIGASSWDDAVTLVILISVVALLKLTLANFMFMAMLRADEQVDRRLVVQEPDPPPQRRVAKVVVVRPLAARTRPAHRAAPRFELVEGRTLATSPLDSPPERKPQR